MSCILGTAAGLTPRLTVGCVFFSTCGDSIVLGVNGTTGTNTTGGFRNALYTNHYGSQPAGVVGFNQVGDVTGTLFAEDRCHGFSGQRCAVFLSGQARDAAQFVTPATNTLRPPGICILWIGTNGAITAAGETDIELDNYELLLAYLYTLRPTMRVIVAPIMPTSDGNSAEKPIFNAGLPAIWAASSQAADGLLVRVGTDVGASPYDITVPASHLPDGIHPSVAHYDTLAAQCFWPALCYASGSATV